MVSNRELRSELMKHLFGMHGAYQSASSAGANLSQLEKLHEAMHLDDYACPPHSHRHDVLDDIKLTFGEDYLKIVIEGIKANG